MSSPLQMALPASFAAFFSRLQNHTIQNLSVKTMQPLHAVLSAIGVSHMEDLPGDTLMKLKEALMTVLKCLDVEEHSTNLFSLAILSKLASCTPHGQELDPDHENIESTQSHSEDDRVKAHAAISAARQFFNVRRTPKILDFVALKAILLCSRSDASTMREDVQGLALCSEIAGNISLIEKRCWLEKSSSKLRKIYDRALREDASSEIKIAVIITHSTFWR